MDQHSLDVLEFHSIKQKLISFAVSGLGKRLCEDIFPQVDKDSIEKALAEVQEAKEIIITNGRFPLEGLTDISSLLEKAQQKRRSFDIREIFDIKNFLEVIKSVVQWRIQIDERYFHLKKYCNKLSRLQELEGIIEKTIDQTGEIKNTASPKLNQIREQIRLEKERISHLLEKYIEKSKGCEIVQENFITIRNDRYVIPIKSNKKAFIQGIIHDQSDSGATIFIEPLESIECQNRYKILKLKEQEEITHLLLAITNNIAASSETLRENLYVLGYLDFIQSKALFSLTIHGIAPIISNEPVINLKQAKHPLLIFSYLDSLESLQPPVPIDLRLDQYRRILIISGPNTGGKTVTLKMVGLLQIMVQSGLHIPAQDGTELGIFKNVLADIGDEQNIAQGLSSFSSHIKNIVNILDQIMPQSMCLFDELCVDTNPSEGSALGMAILEYIFKKKAFCLITTHYHILKTYALSHPENVINASMGFDMDNLSPTFSLHLGLPGNSNAFEICSRFGMPSDILKNAQKFLSESDIILNKLILTLKKGEIRLKEEYERQQKNIKEIEDIKQRYSILRKRIEEREAKIAREAKLRVKKFVDKAHNEVEKIVEELRKTRINNNSLKKAVKDITRVSNQFVQTIPKRTNLKRINIRDISVGQLVLVHNFNEYGIISSVDKKGENIWVMIGPLKIKVKANDLGLIEEEGKKEEKTSVSVGQPKPSSTISPKLNVIGQRVDEALHHIDKYLDQALLAHLSQISIIHGKGTGILKKAIEEFLTSQPHLYKFRSGKPDEGGDGVTIVDLNS